MKNFILSILSVSFLISCSSGGVSGDDFLEPNNTIEDLIINKQWWFESPDSTYGLFFNENDSLFIINDNCQQIFNGLYSINDSVIKIENTINGIQSIVEWNIYEVNIETLIFVIESDGSNFINQVFTNNITLLCSENINTIITSQTYYNKSVEEGEENSQCKEIIYLIFEENGSGSVGRKCNIQSNFTWSLNGNILSITIFNNFIDLEIIEINDTLLVFDQNFYGKHEYSSNIPIYEEQDWSGLSFKLDSTFVFEYTRMGTSIFNNIYLNQINEIIKFCEYDPYTIIYEEGLVWRLNCYNSPESLNYVIEYQEDFLSIYTIYSDPDTYERKIRYYSLIE